MDAIFASEDEEAKGRLLKIMQEFLISESDKHAAKEKNTGKYSGCRIGFRFNAVLVQHRRAKRSRML